MSVTDNGNERELLETLSPNERKILPFLGKSFDELCKLTSLDEVAVLRALQFLENKGLLRLRMEDKLVVVLDENGKRYVREGLPERRLLDVLTKHGSVAMENAAKLAGLDANELRAAIGALKKKAMVEIKDGKLVLMAGKDEAKKKMLEEIFLEKLPLALDTLEPQDKYALEMLRDRKEIVKVEKRKVISYELTELGKRFAGKKVKLDLIEELTPEMLKTQGWRGKKFRRYDVVSAVPKIYGGKKHFIRQAIEHVRKIWLELGFEEMEGPLITTGFWNFDALFTPQDHPARELQDTFFIKGKVGKLPGARLVAEVKKAHEQGIEGSKGWQYKWQEQEARKIVLRTHTTCLSAMTLAKLREADLPAKFFAIGKTYRNETIDYKHLVEFHQTEGIVVSPDVNFRHLLGYLKIFFEKMGFSKIKFVPHYFPYTEPSVEIHYLVSQFLFLLGVLASSALLWIIMG